MIQSRQILGTIVFGGALMLIGLSTMMRTEDSVSAGLSTSNESERTHSSGSVAAPIEMNSRVGTFQAFHGGEANAFANGALRLDEDSRAAAAGIHRGNGQFSVTDQSGEVFEVEVRGSRFQLPVALANIQRFHDLALDGQEAEFSNPEGDVDREPLIFDVRWISQGQLRVIDDDTEVDLDQVTILAADFSTDVSLSFPPEDVISKPVMNGARSPLNLPSPTHSRTTWVGAPGYAWKRFSQRAGATSEQRELRLHRGATVTISLPPHEYARGAHFVRLFDGAGVVAAYHLHGVDDLELAGLNPGEYSVQLEVGHRAGPRAILARKQITLLAGDDEFVTFTRADNLPAPASLRVDVSNLQPHLVTTASLQCTNLAGDVTPFSIAATKMTRGADGSYSLEFQSLEPGSWLVSLQPWGLEQRVDLAAGRTGAMRIDVPDLIPVDVWVLDADTAEELDATMLDWKQVAGASLGEWAFATRAHVGVPFRFWAVPGEVELSVFRTGYSDAPQTITAMVGYEEHFLMLNSRADYRVELSLACKGNPVFVELDDWAEFSIEPLGTGGECIGRDFSRAKIGSSFASSEIDLIVDQPGWYRLMPGYVSGYTSPTRPVEFEVVSSGKTRVTLELVAAVQSTQNSMRGARR